MNRKEINEKVKNFPTKYTDGFTQGEIKSLLRELDIDEKKFNKAFGIQTGIMINGECVLFHSDVETTLVLLSENRELNSFEWD